jgi:uncharacterized protein
MLPRFTCDPLPAYSFVPGKFPHPHSDPGGHGFGSDLPSGEAVDPTRWQASHHYLLGVDLFNNGYYWEAHEVWEALWNASGRHGTTATFVKSLIQLAVVGVKLRQGMVDAAVAHARRAAELLRQVRGQASHVWFMGLNVDELTQWAEQLAVSPSAAHDSERAPVAIVFAFRLVPTPVHAV